MDLAELALALAHERGVVVLGAAVERAAAPGHAPLLLLLLRRGRREQRLTERAAAAAAAASPVEAARAARALLASALAVSQEVARPAELRLEHRRARERRQLSGLSRKRLRPPTPPPRAPDETVGATTAGSGRMRTRRSARETQSGRYVGGTIL